jgi:purine nucleosidase
MDAENPRLLIGLDGGVAGRKDETFGMETLPVLLDTDIGSDIDDAVALAYLLRQPRCELLGITTVSGEPDKRASIADAVCRAAGRDDIPIHVGVENPLLRTPHQTEASHYDALGDRWPHRQFGKDNTAVDFLRETIRSRPGEITLLTVGPLTNIALLFALDLELPKLLRSVVAMGGQFFTRPADGRAEWNILCDPHAAAMVLAACPVTAVGLDVTTKCQMRPDECRTRFAKAGGPLEPVAAMAESWFTHTPKLTFHDPLAAALIFEPKLCKTVVSALTVELISPNTLGQTLLRSESGPKHRIANSVDADAFFAHYFEIIAG